MNVQTQVLEKSASPMHQGINPSEEEAERMVTLIGGRILKRLGKPRYFYKVDVHHLWDNKWRVNVWIKTISEEGVGVVPSHSISDSFFVTVKNNRISTSPKIVKKY